VLGHLPFREVWAVDLEFTAPPGERATPLCLVARDLRSGQLVRTWLTGAQPATPFRQFGPDVLFVAYYASAEFGCYLALGWPLPVRILDLFAEFRCLTSELPVPCGNGLLGALAYFGLDGLAAAEKEDMRELAMRGGPYTAAERLALLDYCQSDVDALARLLPAMLPRIDLPRALLRGRYMAAAARIEWNGVPVDTETLARLREHWIEIKGRLIVPVDRDYNVFVPAGQPTLDPASPTGAAILREAEAWGHDPYRLAEAVDYVWAEERQATYAQRKARAKARQATRLTRQRILDLEHAGQDHSHQRGLVIV
jgi:DNA polymerase I